MSLKMQLPAIEAPLDELQEVLPPEPYSVAASW
jgi:hypothetical protein